MAEREIDIGMAFNISHASNAISEKRLPKTIRSYIHEMGTLANIHFLTIPYNSSKKEAAKIKSIFKKHRIVAQQIGNIVSKKGVFVNSKKIA